MSHPAIRTATPADAGAIHALVLSHQTEGHLLPRDLTEIGRRAARFVVYESDGAIRACAELAPLSDRVAEVRSLVVAGECRRTGIAAALVGEVRQRAKASGFETLCAFTHDARFFVTQNFSMVPHAWLAPKIAADCANCPRFRRCGQMAMMLPLAETRQGAADVHERRVRVA